MHGSYATVCCKLMLISCWGPRSWLQPCLSAFLAPLCIFSGILYSRHLFEVPRSKCAWSRLAACFFARVAPQRPVLMPDLPSVTTVRRSGFWAFSESHHPQSALFAVGVALSCRGCSGRTYRGHACSVHACAFSSRTQPRPGLPSILCRRRYFAQQMVAAKLVRTSSLSSSPCSVS